MSELPSLEEKYTAIYTESWMSGSHMHTIVKMKRFKKLATDNSIIAAAEREGIADDLQYLFIGWPLLQGEYPDDVERKAI